MGGGGLLTNNHFKITSTWSNFADGYFRSKNYLPESKLHFSTTAIAVFQSRTRQSAPAPAVAAEEGGASRHSKEQSGNS